MDAIDTQTVDNIVVKLAERLRIARQLAGLTPEAAAEASGNRISASYIRQLERGSYSPTVEAVAALCLAYKTTLEKLLASLGSEDAGKRKRA